MFLQIVAYSSKYLYIFFYSVLTVSLKGFEHITNYKGLKKAIEADFSESDDEAIFTVHAV